MRLLYRIRDHCHIYPNSGKAQRGMTLVEAIIALLVVFVAITAILVTVAQSTQYIALSRADLNTYTMATNWLEMFEAQNPDLFASDFNQMVTNVAARVAPDATASGTNTYSDGKYKITAARGTIANGVVQVTITITTAANDRNPISLSKTFNTISNDTVWNNSPIRQGGTE